MNALSPLKIGSFGQMRTSTRSRNNSGPITHRTRTISGDIWIPTRRTACSSAGLSFPHQSGCSPSLATSSMSCDRSSTIWRGSSSATTVEPPVMVRRGPSSTLGRRHTRGAQTGEKGRCLTSKAAYRRRLGQSWAKRSPTTGGGLRSPPALRPQLAQHTRQTPTHRDSCSRFLRHRRRCRNSAHRVLHLDGAHQQGRRTRRRGRVRPRRPRSGRDNHWHPPGTSA